LFDPKGHKAMAVQVREILENFPDLVKQARGAAHHSVAGMQDPTLARPEDMIFAATAKHLEEAQGTKAEAWLVHTTLADRVPASAKVVLTSNNVLLCVSFFAKKFFPQTRNHLIIEGSRVSKQAVVSASAKIGANCIISPGAVIGDGCVIGDSTIIGANAVIEPGVKIGKECHIHPLVFIGHSCELGDRCEIHPNTTIGTEGFGYAQDEKYQSHRLTHYGRVILENDVHVGAGVQIDRGTYLDSRIGAGTKIDNHCHFGHNIVIGKNTVITGGMIVAGSTTLGSYSVFGGRTSIAGHLKIADKVQVGGLSGITKSIDKPGMYAGFPLQDLKSDMKVRASIKNLPKLFKQVRAIYKKLGLKDEAEE
jgi:UDP-3-O-[3-hydroxymyristoyl] glucosamine N-acyltransferase